MSSIRKSMTRNKKEKLHNLYMIANEKKSLRIILHDVCKDSYGYIGDRVKRQVLLYRLRVHARDT